MMPTNACNKPQCATAKANHAVTRLCRRLGRIGLGTDRRRRVCCRRRLCAFARQASSSEASAEYDYEEAPSSWSRFLSNDELAEPGVWGADEGEGQWWNDDDEPISDEYLAADSEATSARSRAGSTGYQEPEAAGQQAVQAVPEERVINENVPERFRFHRLLHEAAAEGDADTCSNILADMESMGFPPGPSAYHALVFAHVKARDVDTALEVVKQEWRAGIQPLAETYVVLVYGFIEEGDLERASAVTQSMSRAGKNAELGWLTIVKGLFRIGRPVDAVRELSRGTQDGFNPDSSLFETVISTYCSCGLTKLAKVVINDMPSFKVQPTTRHLNILLKAVAQEEGLVAAMKSLAQDFRNIEDLIVSIGTFHAILEGALEPATPSQNAAELCEEILATLGLDKELVLGSSTAASERFDDEDGDAVYDADEPEDDEFEDDFDELPLEDRAAGSEEETEGLYSEGVVGQFRHLERMMRARGFQPDPRTYALILQLALTKGDESDLTQVPQLLKALKRSAGSAGQGRRGRWTSHLSDTLLARLFQVYARAGKPLQILKTLQELSLANRQLKPQLLLLPPPPQQTVDEVVSDTDSGSEDEALSASLGGADAADAAGPSWMTQWLSGRIDGLRNRPRFEGLVDMLGSSVQSADSGIRTITVRVRKSAGGEEEDDADALDDADAEEDDGNESGRKRKAPTTMEIRIGVANCVVDESGKPIPPSKMLVPQLRAELEARNESTEGSRQELFQRVKLQRRVLKSTIEQAEELEQERQSAAARARFQSLVEQGVNLSDRQQVVQKVMRATQKRQQDNGDDPEADTAEADPMKEATVFKPLVVTEYRDFKLVREEQLSLTVLGPEEEKAAKQLMDWMDDSETATPEGTRGQGRAMALDSDEQREMLQSGGDDDEYLAGQVEAGGEEEEDEDEDDDVEVGDDDDDEEEEDAVAVARSRRLLAAARGGDDDEAEDDEDADVSDVSSEMLALEADAKELAMREEEEESLQREISDATDARAATAVAVEILRLAQRSGLSIPQEDFECAMQAAEAEGSWEGALALHSLAMETQREQDAEEEDAATQKLWFANYTQKAVDVVRGGEQWKAAARMVKDAQEAGIDVSDIVLPTDTATAEALAQT